MRWNDLEVRAALGLPGGDPTVSYQAIVTDTRAMVPGAVFVALSGPHFDGHAFLEAAAQAGAQAAIVRTGTAPVGGLRLHEVDDPLVALGLLARHRRRKITGPVVAITGTNGKTSTKEMVAAVVGAKHRVHATRLNLNNLIGVPQTILEAPDDSDALVVEAGANIPGEIARYREIIEPTIAVITNVAPGHLEGFGSVQGVMREKLQLVRDVPLAVVGAEPESLRVEASRVARRVVCAGLDQADLTPERITLDAEGQSTFVVDEVTCHLPLLGAHQVANAMLAWAVGRELGIAPDAIGRALESVRLPAGRGEIRREGALTLVNDGYNANPGSFRATIDLARRLRGSRRLVFVAGTMRELGGESDRHHREVAEWLVALDPDLLAAVGEFGPALEPHRAKLGDRLVVADDAIAMGKLLGPMLRGDELVVLKGSRGVALERIIPDLLATHNI